MIMCYTVYVKNLTLAIEEHVLEGARRAALDRSTTVNQLVRDYLTALVREADRKQAAISRLNEAMSRGIADVGPILWTRDELHERR
jgi:hypothetical protein